jgi:hypothetical protein
MSFARTILRPVAYLAGRRAASQLREFLDAHDNTAGVQQRLLDRMLSLHAKTAFGREHGFERIRSYEDFKSAVPVRDYDDLRPWLGRVYEGEFDAMLPPGEQVLMFSQTSGTTGEPKYLPVTARFLGEMRRGWNIFGLGVLRDHPEGWLRPILQISSPMDESRSPTNIPCGAISGLLAATQQRIVRRMYVVPPPVAAVRNPDARYYTTLRCGVGRDVGIITTANPSSTIRLIETGQAHAELLIRDIADGTLTPPGELPSVLKRRLRFRKNPRLARRIEAGLAADGQLLPKHFWNVVFLTNWTGGTLHLYLPHLRRLFGDVPVRDIGLLASEGRFSVPVQDHTPAGPAEIIGNFLEFIPAAERESDDPVTLRAHELELGEEYFLVVTNWAGLWRYNLDDRIRVAGFTGQTPVFEFLSRGLRTASMTGEKVTEHQVVQAMRRALGNDCSDLERFILQPRFDNPPFYELLIERDAGDADQLAGRLDACLSELNIEYASKRASSRLDGIRAIQLPPGEMARIEADAIARRGGRSEQYKHQYLRTEVLTATDSNA